MHTGTAPFSLQSFSKASSPTLQKPSQQEKTVENWEHIRTLPELNWLGFRPWSLIAASEADSAAEEACYWWVRCTAATKAAARVADRTDAGSSPARLPLLSMGIQLTWHIMQHLLLLVRLQHPPHRLWVGVHVLRPRWPPPWQLLLLLLQLLLQLLLLPGRVHLL